jgi:hypothetical protein
MIHRAMEGAPMTAPPTLSAYRVGYQYVVWCAYCRKWHYHGAARDGHRLAHCSHSSSPYLTSGYILHDVGPAPADVLSDLKRRRPQGVGVRTDD